MKKRILSTLMAVTFTAGLTAAVQAPASANNGHGNFYGWCRGTHNPHEC
jgi:hypothetical protein